MINKDVWQLLKELYLKFPELKHNDATDKQICEAENSLNLKFSDFYRYFLKNHALSSIGNYTINTLNKPTNADNSSCLVVDATIQFRRNKHYPSSEDYYIIATSDKGELIAAGPKGEICIIRHDKELKQKIADNFEEFLHQLLVKI